MNNLLYYVLAPASTGYIQIAVCIMRIGIGLLAIGHGIPKIMGGFGMWRELGAFMHPLGVYFLPVMWGFLAAVTEFFGGIALVIGLGTRIASAALIFMMFVAFMWHLHKGDPFSIYSFPLSLIIIYTAFFIIGGGSFSLDNFIVTKN